MGPDFFPLPSAFGKENWRMTLSPLFHKKKSQEHDPKKDSSWQENLMAPFPSYSTLILDTLMRWDFFPCLFPCVTHFSLFRSHKYFFPFSSWQYSHTHIGFLELMHKILHKDCYLTHMVVQSNSGSKEQNIILCMYVSISLIPFFLFLWNLRQKYKSGMFSRGFFVMLKLYRIHSQRDKNTNPHFLCSSSAASHSSEYLSVTDFFTCTISSHFLYFLEITLLKL